MQGWGIRQEIDEKPYDESLQRVRMETYVRYAIQSWVPQPALVTSH